VAAIFARTLWIHSLGTWQSGHVARTPERFLKWMVFCNSAYGFARISWHEMQNDSVFASSIAQLKPPQNRTPNMAPATTNVPRAKRLLGREMKAHVRAMNHLSLGGGVSVGSLTESLPSNEPCRGAAVHHAPANAVRPPSEPRGRGCYAKIRLRYFLRASYRDGGASRRHSHFSDE
jgi:hypothetical protein